MIGPLTPERFIAKWSRAELSERAASQEHLIDPFRLPGQATLAEHDATGVECAFEKGVVLSGTAGGRASKAGGDAHPTQVGERGFADVWRRGKFAWEYKRKGKYKNLADAYRQLCQLREVESRFRYTPPTCFETFPLPPPTCVGGSDRGGPGCPANSGRGGVGSVRRVST